MHRSHVQLELVSTWARLTLGQFRGMVLLSALPVMAAMLLAPLVRGRPLPWEALATFPIVWLIMAAVLPLFAARRDWLQFDGRSVRRPGTLDTPLVIPVDELDLPRSRRRTWLDRFVGRQRLWRTDGRRIEFALAWYSAAEREAFLEACFAAAEAAQARSARAGDPAAAHASARDATAR